MVAATPALSSPVSLSANPMDDDGRITLGELFDGAGSASSVVVARRSGPTAVLDAGQIQAAARPRGAALEQPRRSAPHRGATGIGWRLSHPDLQPPPGVPARRSRF
nr:hypothetical protein [Brevundimonas denitrificans]